MLFKHTVAAGVLAATLVPLSGLAQQPQQPADPGTSPGSSASTPATPAPAASPLTGNIGLFSQYIFRGLTQTDRNPALQGGFDYAHPSGFYVGTWASNISWLRDSGAYRSGGSLEWDFYGGYKIPVGDFGFDLGTLYYWYPGDEAFTAPGAAASNPKGDTWEIYGAASWKWLSLKYSYSVKNETFAVRDSSGSWYLDLTAAVPLGDFVKVLDGVTFTAHYGRQKYDGSDPRNVGGRSNDDLYTYNDWKVGLSYALPQNFTIGAFYTDTSGANRLGYGSVGEGGVYPRNIAKGTGTVYLQKTF